MNDTAIQQLIDGERQRQQAALELIPSENYVSKDVLAALGSVFTNKYAEGYPGRRYYGGQLFTDQLERLAIERAKALFGADHANVQSHSGAPANEAVYGAWCDAGDTILAMDLSHGGHLTHGAPVTQMAKLYNFVRYGMKDVETGDIDYDHLAALAEQHKPKIILAGFSAYPRELDYEKFVAIGHQSGALLVADMAHIAGLIAGHALKNPLTAGFHVMTSTTHKTLRGPRGGLIISNGVVGNPLKVPERTIDNIPTLIDRLVFPGLQGGPHMHSIAAKAVAFGEAATPEFRQYAAQVLKNAKVLADELMRHGFKLITNGTDNHLILIDMKKSLDIDGAQAEAALDAVGLTANKNAVPDDPLPPFRPSGLRLGTPAVTTRGLKEADMVVLAGWIKAAIAARDDPAKLARLKEEVSVFARSFPLPG